MHQENNNLLKAANKELFQEGLYLYVRSMNGHEDIEYIFIFNDTIKRNIWDIAVLGK